MESRFMIDLTGGVPEDICPRCAKENGLGHESGARAVFCEHTGAAYMKLRTRPSWTTSRVENFPMLVLAFENALALAEAVAVEQARNEPKQ